MPVKAGKFEVFGVRATVNKLDAASRLTIYDGAGKIVDDDNTVKPIICDIIGVATADAYLVESFSEPIKVRDGISVSNAENLVGGRTIVFVR